MSYRLSNIVLMSVLVGGSWLQAQPESVVRVELAKVEAGSLDTMTTLPGELLPYQSVNVFAKVAGFVESITVDRGSRVKAGQLLARLRAPELEARRLEIEARIPSIEAQRVEAAARLAGAEGTFERLVKASEVPGVVASNDVLLAEKAVEAERAHISALEKNVAAVEASVRAVEELKEYLEVTAPFDGIVTERFAHVGSLAGEGAPEAAPLFRIEQVNRLRLVAAVPEAFTESIHVGKKVQFTVQAYPGKLHEGTVARPAFSMNPSTRTMPVELDVANGSGKLTPGMYAEIKWPVNREAESLFVPMSAVKSTTQSIFVVRVAGGQAEWVEVKRGLTKNGLVEVFGDLQAGDQVVLRATDEIRPGTRVEAR